jgi:hypothetical protein
LQEEPSQKQRHDWHTWIKPECPPGGGADPPANNAGVATEIMKVMPASRFDLMTDWSFDAPLPAVWAALIAPEEWSGWWPALVKVERLANGDERGIGSVRRMTWRTALPYTLTFDMCTTRIEPMIQIEGRAEGELRGIGCWTLVPDGARTQVRYHWNVEVKQPWMRLLAPLARPAFAWNHGVVMRGGQDGLTRRLAGHHSAIPAKLGDAEPLF